MLYVKMTLNPSDSSMYTQEDVQILLKLDAFKVGFTPQDNSEIYSDFEIVSVVTVNIF